MRQQFKTATGVFTSFGSADGLNVSTVPEPTTMAIAFTGLMMPVLSRRRRHGEPSARPLAAAA
ncbi:MAG: PEP-CTERM sorting domain-containing protein [Massilia sp.]